MPASRWGRVERREAWSDGYRMLDRRRAFARTWRFWGGGLGGAFLVAHLVGASGQSPTQGDEPQTVGTAEANAADSWRVGVPVGVRVERGRAVFRAPTPSPGSGVLLIVSSLAREAGPFPISLRVRDTARAEAPEVAEPGGSSKPPTFEPAALPAVPPEAATTPPASRTFHLMVREGDAASSRNYEAVNGRLRAIGKRVQVYVAEEDVARVGAEVLKDIVETFDSRIFPKAAATFGLAHDIDADGRFTVLLSSWLARMGRGKHAVDGFVRVADLDSDYAAPFGNRCDMMYLSTDLQPGPHLRTVIAHEYTHAVTFSRKSLGVGRLPSDGWFRVEEEGWLDEALAHLAEDLHGFSRSNLEYRVSAFLSAPERYRLIVDDYYAANLFRSHGNRGSTYLFLRWCVDRFGAGLVPTLIGSGKSGVANLEAATGARFADLYRGWSLALASSALGPEVIAADQGRPGFRSIGLEGGAEGRCLAGPRIDRVRPGHGDESWNATGTSSRYWIVEKGSTEAVEVEVSGSEGADLQVTAVPLPRDLPSLNVTLRASYDVDGDLNLKIATRIVGGGAFRWVSIAWEPLVPPANPNQTSLPRGSLDLQAIAARFGGLTLENGTSLQSSPIKLAGIQRTSGRYILKLVGVDSKGRNVTAWADINTPPSSVPRTARRDLDEFEDGLATTTVE